ncbi:MAG: amidohydrolase family protein [Acidobacteria bacterium]|nr:amidohydrolase family protein [Acidobacteriota bacterium]
MSHRIIILFSVLLSCLGSLWGQEATLFRNVRIFDGVEPDSPNGYVLVLGHKITKISTKPFDAPENCRILEGNGRILAPGFIDLHSHLCMQMPKDRMDVNPTVTGALAAQAARFYLESGFTTVRDAGGTSPDFAHAIDAGLIFGPRVFASGSMISQTGGHGDFRKGNAADWCGAGPHAVGASELSILADGVDQTLTAVRENLRRGATQIKIMGGGGIASENDPLYSLQSTPEEIRAAVQAASDWGTYVMAHAYTADAVQRLIANGVQVIEHGHLIDDKTARLCAEKGIVISTQVSIFLKLADLPGMTERNQEKLTQVLQGMDQLMALIKKYKIKTGFGTDFVFGQYDQIGTEFSARARFFSNAEIMRQATSESAQVIRLAGKLNRYGNFGEIREGWLADLVLLEGDPFSDIRILENPQQSVALVMKDGQIVVDRTKPKGSDAN